MSARQGAEEKRSQREKILGLLRAHGAVSAHDLTYRHGITRTAARIFELRREGYVIETAQGATLPDGTRGQASYRLLREPAGRAAPIEQQSLW